MHIELIVRAALFTPGARGNWGLPLLFWGNPGISKTDRIEGVARSCGLPCEVLSPGERGEAAFGVIPVPREVRWKEDGEEKSKYYITNPQPEWVEQFEEADGAGLVFVDETTTAPPALQPALLGLIHARRIGGGFLGKRVRVLGAANAAASSAGGYDLAPPVANRLGHIEWPIPSEDEWIAWLTGHTGDAKKMGDAKKLEELVMAKWDSAFARAKGFISGFLKSRREAKTGKSFLYNVPKLTDPNVGRAWCSPRTMELATRAYAGGTIHNLSEEEDLPAFVASFIGDGAATEFFAYVRDNDLPLPEDVLDGKVKFVHDERRLDRTHAVISSCIALIVPPKAPKRDERADKMWGIIEGLIDEKADDLVVLMTWQMIAAKLHDRASAVSVLNKAKPILKASGISRESKERL